MAADIFDNLVDNRFRCWGSGMTRIHGRDMTGKSSYSLAPAAFGETLREHHQIVSQTKAAAADVLSFGRPSGLGHTPWVVRLPLSNTGEPVDQVVVIAWYSDEALTWSAATAARFCCKVDIA
ncbi:MAG: hypothetical protein VW268_00020 [Rhodospirillaceae bacterium]